MKTFKRTSLPDFIKYNNKTYVLGEETSKSIRVEVLSRNLIGVLDNNGFAYKPSVLFEIFHRLGSNYFILEKDQVETLIKWLNEKVVI